MSENSKPNRENIRRWVKALRSGLYKQGTQRLKNQDGTMCCLGVACDVSHLGSWAPAKESQFGDVTGESYLGAESVLPPQVREWLGLEYANPNLNALPKTIAFPGAPEGTEQPVTCVAANDTQLRNDDNTLCCLGVACDVSSLGQWQQTRLGASMRYVVDGETDQYSALPAAVMDWLGLEEKNPYLRGLDWPTSAAVANDERHLTYAEIATALEKQFLSGPAVVEAA